MIHVGKRADRPPMLFSASGVPEDLKRIRLDSRVLDERWIQNLIREHPALIPMVPDLHAFNPLVPIGYEVNTPVGRLDNLYISPSGHITLVETKLWRNSEARREVVGQIIEYAAHLKGWSYDRLDQVAKDYGRKFLGEAIGLFDLVSRVHAMDEDDAADFHDGVSRSLANGRFLLTIVGDGIRESLEDMVDLIHGQPGVQFSLSLVELQIFETANGRKLVVPSLVSRTVEVERAVVRVVGGGSDVPAISVAVPEDQQPARSGDTAPRRYTLGETEFFEYLAEHSGSESAKAARRLIEETRELGCTVEWKQSSFAIKMPNLATNGPPFSLLIVTKRNGVHTRTIGRQLDDAGLDRQIGVEYVSKAAGLFPNVNVVMDDNKPSYWSRSVGLEELMKKWDTLKALLVEVMGRINDAVDAGPNSDED